MQTFLTSLRPQLLLATFSSFELGMTFVEPIMNVTVYKGENVTVTCKVMVADSLPSILWLVQNGEKNTLRKVRDTARSNVGKMFHNTVNNTFETTLQLLHVTREDDANYYCLAGNTVEIIRQEFRLSVLPRPTPTPTMSKYLDVL